MKEIFCGNPTCPHCGVTYPIYEHHNCPASQEEKLKQLRQQVASLTEAVEVHRVTLRDQLAMAALAFIERSYPEGQGVNHDAVARLAYDLADAMLMAREKRNDTA